MLIPLNEPSKFRYIYINPVSNHVHLLFPFIAGLDVSTDNTCKADLELKAFFEGGAFNELNSYKSTLEFHLSLLEEGDVHYRAKKERLAQINRYLEAVVGMRNTYKGIINDFLARPSNLYSLQLRPKTQDSYSRVVNPVFTINRGNDSHGTPLSSLYNKMHEMFPQLTFGKPDVREQLITDVSNALPEGASFEEIRRALAAQCNVQEDFFTFTLNENHRRQVVNKAYIDGLMGFDEETTPKEYIDALLGICAPSIRNTLPGSPFYLDTSGSDDEKTERLSILTQFYLGVLNVHCRAKGISNKNFGAILDSSAELSQELVVTVSAALSFGEDAEQAIVKFFNAHKKQFNLSRHLAPADKDAIQQKFETTYRTVTATKENPHMDDFMFLDTQARDNNAIYTTRNGLICADFSHIAPATTSNRDYFARMRQEALAHRDIVRPQDEPVITIDIEPEALVNKLDELQWDRLPLEVIDACHALPAFKARQFLDDVAKGKQDEAEAILDSSDDIQILLRTPGKFTDYSGRIYHCTAYEYAYWAKDTHMQRMLERHMDDETKAFLLGKIDEIERSGLAYQQHGVSYQNAHYDMSFVLKNLSIEEFHHLKAMVGQNSPKVQQATADNYKNISFTATEYETLKKILEQYRPMGILSFFTTSPAKSLSKKLQFDFHSLITALDTYVTHYNEWNSHQLDESWMKVGKAQRDVPAHWAQEYCRLDRRFDQRPVLNEATLPRELTFHNCTTHRSDSWFPLAASNSGLGFDFALIRVLLNGGADVRCRGARAVSESMATVDLAAITRFDEVRTDDLTQSREHLNPPAMSQSMSV